MGSQLPTNILIPVFFFFFCLIPLKIRKKEKGRTK